MIEPPPAAIIGSTATRMPRNVPVRLTSITFCHLARSKLFEGAERDGAGVVDQHVELAEFADRGGDRGVPLVGLR